ncbi:MAG: hypothetical protein COW01_14335 [Bdellovibrionales bacterium CG12_big_fil_rev_8_21_14_0_65_38_15]|nr:MAG: hypothetical protein COW79_17155 [Bdellovibrionales bacterium CG22_combo_CG10-13_8_21_14_all_38_13]PIQ53452.1 MAG: hypothetical protein COW01_14335 [Bdellovibrionales bacterium CG12_big_fil_rev_8_21_14_0_65_38_15]PIR30185.1 MAG: hypothetical protein COV38_05420 [Bdellovibrionales bacterium CG11_big_fil_rev_8_21_14_0_20_38_13]
MKISPNIAFNKINDDEIKVLKLDDDNNVYTLEKSVAHVFDMINKEEKIDAITKSISEQTKKDEKEVVTFVNETIEEFKKLGFFE